MSYRNAQALTEQIAGPAAAAKKLDNALIEGDPLTPQAIARYAAYQAPAIPGLPNPHWAGVLDSCTVANPSAGVALTQLADLGPSGVGSQFRKVVYFLTPKPSELDRLHDHQIEHSPPSRTNVRSG